MKKRIYKAVIISALICIMVSITGCAKKAIVINVSGLAERLYNEIDFKSSMNEADDDMFFMTYGIKKEQIVAQKTYLSEGGTAEEISVVECSDSVEAVKVRNAFESRVSNQINSYKDYIPEELEKLNSPVIRVKGKYVVLCISDNNDKANSIIGN